MLMLDAVQEEQQRRELEAAMELSNRLNYEGDMQVIYSIILNRYET